MIELNRPTNKIWIWSHPRISKSNQEIWTLEHYEITVLCVRIKKTQRFHNFSNIGLDVLISTPTTSRLSPCFKSYWTSLLFILFKCFYMIKNGVFWIAFGIKLWKNSNITKISFIIFSFHSTIIVSSLKNYNYERKLCKQLKKGCIYLPFLGTEHLTAFSVASKTAKSFLYCLQGDISR